MFRYYSVARPVMPGSYPKPEKNEILCIQNFDNRTYVEEISRPAWGYRLQKTVRSFRYDRLRTGCCEDQDIAFAVSWGGQLGTVCIQRRTRKTLETDRLLYAKRGVRTQVSIILLSRQ